MYKKSLILTVGIVLTITNFLVAAESAKTTTVKQEVTLTDEQLKSIKLATAQDEDFIGQLNAVGIIDFNQDKTVQVFPPWQGRINQIFYTVGSDVKKGSPLFTIDSPDFVQAESNLISTYSTLELSNKTLSRIKKLIDSQAYSQKDLEQAIANQEAAEASYKAALDSIKIFGVDHAEIQKLIKSKKIDKELTINSPFTGRITQRNASVGTLVQPGSAQPPFVIADISKMWMIANINEVDLPSVKIGEKVIASVIAYPGKTFEGTVTNIAASIDPNTHRISIKSEISDSNHDLKPQMLGSFTIKTGNNHKGVSAPLTGVVREGNGTFSVFVTKNGKTFEKRSVKLGLTQGTTQEVIEGLAVGERFATDGALFISNSFALKYQ